MSTPDTRERILDAAEHLFALHGFGGTSLRAITSEARTNLASVNYHFGSKESLIHAVFSRRIEPVNRERLRLLDQAESAASPEAPPVESIIRAFVTPPLNLQEILSAQPDICKLLGRIYSEPRELTLPILEQFDEVRRRFGAALQRALPGMPENELCWRLFFMVGSVVMILTNTDILRDKSDGLCDPSDVEGTIDRLVVFLSAGMQTPAPENAGEIS